jgi:hypothetical protein
LSEYFQNIIGDYYKKRLIESGESKEEDEKEDEEEDEEEEKDEKEKEGEKNKKEENVDKVYSLHNKELFSKKINIEKFLPFDRAYSHFKKEWLKKYSQNENENENEKEKENEKIN